MNDRPRPVYAGRGHHLVRMLYDEKETAFPPSCRPFSRGSHFYDRTELQRCHGVT